MTEQHENLLAAYFANQASEEDKEQILHNIETDPEFAARFRELEAAYVAAAMPAFEKTKAQDYKALQKRITPRIIWRPIAVAASIAAILAAGLALHHNNQYREAERFLSQVTTVTAQRGSLTETVLPDGTHACINAASSISFGRDFGRGAREVTLEGEGYFEVAHDAANPFRVHAGNTCVTVKGTVFNVRSYADEPEIEVSLLEGSVLLSSTAGEVTLKPGTCAVVSRESGKIRLEKADPAVSAWTRGKIVFTDKSIPEILGYIGRQYGVQFSYKEGLFGDERFTGNISSGLSIDDILRYMDVDHKYRWTRKDDTIEIHKK